MWVRVEIAFLLFAMAPVLARADRTLDDKTTSTLIFRKIAVPATVFSKDYAVERSRRFLAENPTKKMIRLTLVPDEKPAIFSLVGCDHCDPYHFWRGQWDATGTAIFPLAELMSIEGNSVLRYRDKRGAVSAVALQGSDPRPVRIGAYGGKVIH